MISWLSIHLLLWKQKSHQLFCLNTWSFDQIRLVLCQFQSKYVGHDVVKLKLLKKIVRNLGKLLQAIWDFLWHTKNMVFFNDPSIYRITINVTCIIGCAQCITMICVKWIFSGKNLSLWSHRHLTPRYFTLAHTCRLYKKDGVSVTRLLLTLLKSAFILAILTIFWLWKVWKDLVFYYCRPWPTKLRWGFLSMAHYLRKERLL